MHPQSNFKLQLGDTVGFGRLRASILQNVFLLYAWSCRCKGSHTPSNSVKQRETCSVEIIHFRFTEQVASGRIKKRTTVEVSYKGSNNMAMGRLKYGIQRGPWQKLTLTYSVRNKISQNTEGVNFQTESRAISWENIYFRAIKGTRYSEFIDAQPARIS